MAGGPAAPTGTARHATDRPGLHSGNFTERRGPPGSRRAWAARASESESESCARAPPRGPCPAPGPACTPRAQRQLLNCQSPIGPTGSGHGGLQVR